MSAVADPRARPAFARLRAVCELGRPGVLALVALTVPPVLLTDGHPASTSIAALLGVTLLAGGASAANAVWERDLDARMARTRGRPLPSGRLTVDEALAATGIALVAALGLLAVAGGPLAVGVALAALVVYVGLYTVALKPRTAWQMPVGALAGAAPPLVADAIDGRLGALGLAVFGLVVAWQVPHYLAIALVRRADYAAGNVPTAPSRLGARAARWLVVLGAGATLGASLLPWAAGHAGPAYALVAAVAGLWLAERAAAACQRARLADDRRVFFATIAHLTLVCAALTADVAAG